MTRPSASIRRRYRSLRGSAAVLVNPTSVDPTITPDLSGIYTVSLTVTDGQATSSPDTVDITVPVPSVLVPDVINLPQASAEAAISAAVLTVGAVTSVNSDTVPAGSVISQDPVGGSLVSPGSPVSLVVSLGPSGEGLPPDPATFAPPVDPTVATTIGRSTEFLYTGTNPIQTGVAAGTIDPKRAAVIRGKVLTREGTALSAVQISVKDHPEFGQTLSRADGMFDLAVNGGGLLTVSYVKNGLLPAQRQMNVPWQSYASAPDVVMIEPDSAVAVVDLSASTEIQVARGSTVADADGTRRATLFFPPGLSARMTLADGSSAPLSTLSVRATEYTVGPNGPLAMPGLLPPMSGYTYAVDLTVDEALAAGATKVSFDQPVATYLKNFLNFPTGAIVPSGYYDLGLGQWVPMPNDRSWRSSMRPVPPCGACRPPTSARMTSTGRSIHHLYRTGENQDQGMTKTRNAKFPDRSLGFRARCWARTSPSQELLTSSFIAVTALWEGLRRERRPFSCSMKRCRLVS